jgi:hypothetical protein
MKTMKCFATCAVAFLALVITSCTDERYDLTQGTNGRFGNSTTTVIEKDTVAADTTADGTILLSTFEMVERTGTGDNVLVLDQKSTLIEQKGDDRNDNAVQLELNGTATNVSQMVYAESLTRKYRQVRKGAKRYSDITRNHPDFVGEVEETSRQEEWEGDGHKFVIDITEQNAIAYSSFSDTAVTLQSVRVDTSYVSNVNDVRTGETRIVNDSVYAAVNREVEITYDGTIVPAVGTPRQVSFKRYLKTADDIYEFDHIVDPGDTIPVGPDTIPVGPDTIPVIPDPDEPGYPFQGGEIKAVYASFCLVPGSLDLRWVVLIQTETTVVPLVFPGDGAHYVSNKVFTSPNEISGLNPSDWNSANAYGTPAYLQNDGRAVTWTFPDGSYQQAMTESLPLVVDVSLVDGEMVQKIDLNSLQKTETSTIIPIPAISGIRNAFTVTITQ